MATTDIKLENDSGLSETIVIEDVKSNSESKIKVRWEESAFSIKSQDDLSTDGFGIVHNLDKKKLENQLQNISYVKYSKNVFQEHTKDSPNAQGTSNSILSGNDSSLTGACAFVAENSAFDTDVADHNDIEVEKILEKFTSARSFHCDFCGCAFQRKTRLILHQKKHQILGHSKVSRVKPQNKSDKLCKQNAKRCLKPIISNNNQYHSNTNKKICLKNGFKRRNPNSKLVLRPRKSIPSKAKLPKAADVQRPISSNKSPENNTMSRAHNTRFFRHIASPKTENEISMFSCSLCSMSFSAESILKEHMFIHSSSQSLPFYCSQCNKSFSARFSFNNHMQSHRSEVSNKSAEHECQDESNISENHIRHRNLGSSDVFDEQITAIDIKQEPPDDYEESEFTHSANDDENIGSRYYDNGVYPSGTNALYSESHQSDFLPVMKSTNNLVLDIKQEVEDESYTNTNARTNPESDVEESYKSESESNPPEVTGNRIDESKIFQCNKCDKAFFKRYDLLVHRKEHTSSEIIACDICKKRFSCQSDLNRHSVVHGNARPFVCNECGKGFRRLSNLKEHQRIHNGQYPFKCDICSRGFNSRPLVRSHMLKHRRNFAMKTLAKEMKMADNQNLNVVDDELNKQCHVNTLEEFDSIHLSGVLENGVNKNTVSNTGNDDIKLVLNASSSDPKSYECKRCDKTFNNRCDFFQHKKVHTDGKVVSCTICKKWFSSEKDLTRHAVIHCKVRPYRCNDCGCSFRRQSNLNLHQRVHTGLYPFKCKSCLRGFNSRPNLSDHMLKFNGRCTQIKQGSSVKSKTPVPVDVSHTLSDIYKSKNNNTMQRHAQAREAVTEVQLPFSCYVCKHRCESRNLLKVHMLSHRKIESIKELSHLVVARGNQISAPSYKCEICDIRHETIDKLEDHIKENHGNMPPQNDLDTTCIVDAEPNTSYLVTIDKPKSNTISVGDVSAFSSTAEKESETFKYKCNICSTAFQRLSHLRLHKMEHRGEEPLSCEVCEKLFSCPSDLRRHFSTHFDIRPFTCEICHQDFKRKSNYDDHKRLHLRKNFKCGFCFKNFETRECLKEHLLDSHEEEMTGKSGGKGNNISDDLNDTLNSDNHKYQCRKCSEGFNRKQAFALHKLKHTGEEPFTCKHCGKQFAYHSDYGRHLLTHTDERPFQCPLCSKCFRRNADMQKHIAKHDGSNNQVFNIIETVKRTRNSKRNSRKSRKIHEESLNNVKTKINEDGSMYVLISGS